MTKPLEALQLPLPLLQPLAKRSFEQKPFHKTARCKAPMRKTCQEQTVVWTQNNSNMGGARNGELISQAVKPGA